MFRTQAKHISAEVLLRAGGGDRQYNSNIFTLMWFCAQAVRSSIPNILTLMCCCVGRRSVELKDITTDVALGGVGCAIQPKNIISDVLPFGRSNSM